MVTKYLIPFCLPLILCHFAYSILFNIILIWMGWMDGWMDGWIFFLNGNVSWAGLSMLLIMCVFTERIQTIIINT